MQDKSNKTMEFKAGKADKNFRLHYNPSLISEYNPLSRYAGSPPKGKKFTSVKLNYT